MKPEIRKKREASLVRRGLAPAAANWLLDLECGYTVGVTGSIRDLIRQPAYEGKTVFLAATGHTLVFNGGRWCAVEGWA